MLVEKLLSTKLPPVGVRGRITKQNFMKSYSFNEKFIGKLSLDTVGLILGAGNRKHFWKRGVWKDGRMCDKAQARLPEPK